MLKKLKQHLQRIQNSDEATKKRWLIGASAVTMVLVVGLWLIFFNFTIKPTPETTVQEPSIGFWQIFKTGLKVIGDSVWNNIKNVISKITGERTIIIE